MLVHRQKPQIQTCFSLFDGERRSNSIRGVLEMPSRYTFLHGRSINILPSCDWKLSWMDISQRSCRKPTAGWIASHESVYKCAGCNNQTVRSGDFMCGRQSIKREAGLKRSDYDLTFSSALKPPAAEILRMRCHPWATNECRPIKLTRLYEDQKLCPNIRRYLFMYKQSY